MSSGACSSRCARGRPDWAWLGTAAHRSLEDETLASLLRSESYTGGVDFSHEFLRRTVVEAFFSASHVTGSTAAMIRPSGSLALLPAADADYLDGTRASPR
jgi:hypothetical protein